MVNIIKGVIRLIVDNTVRSSDDFDNAILTEDGNFLTTEDGNVLIKD